jgi:putative endonuclease
MYYVYVLESEKDGKRYIGQTNNLQERVKRHQSGRVPATKSRLPLKLIYSEEHATRSEAMKREGWLKQQKSRASIDELIEALVEIKHPIV